LRVLCGTYIGIHVAETESTLVGAPKGIWRANLDHLYLGFHFFIVYVSRWNPNVGRKHSVFVVVNHNYEMGYVNY